MSTGTAQPGQGCNVKNSLVGSQGGSNMQSAGNRECTRTQVRRKHYHPCDRSSKKGFNNCYCEITFGPSLLHSNGMTFSLSRSIGYITRVSGQRRQNTEHITENTVSQVFGHLLLREGGKNLWRREVSISVIVHVICVSYCNYKYSYIIAPL